jgi:hypothetical protein
VTGEQAGELGAIVRPPGSLIAVNLAANQPTKKAPPKRGFLGVLQGGEICVLSVGGSRCQAPSGRLNRVEAVSAICAEPNPTKKIVATKSPAIPATTPAAMVAAASV